MSFLKEWVEKNKWMLEILIDAYCVVDKNNQVVAFNPAFMDLSGENYRKILKIGNFCELVKTEVCPHQCPSMQAMQFKKSIRLDELQGVSKSYPTLQMIVSSVPISSSEGGIEGALVTIRNVSAESELQKKYDDRKKESVVDGLTKLFNKKFAEDILFKSVKNYLRDRKSLCVVLMDIDHFKKVNDTYGHQAGDYVLSQVAMILKAQARDNDIVGRFGGEEFIAILNADTAGSMIFAERFRKKVESTKMIFDGKNIPVTISLGLSTMQEEWSPNCNPDQMMKDLISQADQALYFSKKNGRNQANHFEKIKEQLKKAA